MNSFLEGAEAIRLPCTLALLVPALAVVLAAGRRAGFAIVGFAVGAALIAWARFADTWLASPSTAVSVVLGAGVALGGVGLWRAGNQHPSIVAPVATLVGATTAWLWEPCVGPHLGATINRAPQDKLATIAPTFAYIGGTLLIAIAIAIAPVAAPKLAALRDHQAVRLVGVATGALVGGAIAVGLYDDLVSELLRASRI